MQPASYHLENTWSPEGGKHGRLTLTLFNFSDAPLTNFRLAYTTLTRVVDPEACDNAVFVRRNANFHELRHRPASPSVPARVGRSVSPPFTGSRGIAPTAPNPPM